MHDYASMKSSELKALMAERGLASEDCLEKDDFVKRLVAYDQVTKPSPSGESKEKKTKAPKVDNLNGPAPKIRKNSPAFKFFEKEMMSSLPETDPKKLAKLIAIKWAGLSRTEKLHWSERGKAAGVVPKSPSNGVSVVSSKFLKMALLKPDPKDLKVPTASVKKTVHLNEDVGPMSAETMGVVTRAAELFVGWMAETLSQCVSAKTISVRDYHRFLKSLEKLRFLRATLETTPQGNPVDDPSVALFKGARSTPQPKKKREPQQGSEDEDVPLNLKKHKVPSSPSEA